MDSEHETIKVAGTNELYCLVCKKRWDEDDNAPKCVSVFSPTSKEKVDRMWLDTSKHRIRR